MNTNTHRTRPHVAYFYSRGVCCLSHAECSAVVIHMGKKTKWSVFQSQMYLDTDFHLILVYKLSCVPPSSIVCNISSPCLNLKNSTSTHSLPFIPPSGHLSGLMCVSVPGFCTGCNVFVCLCLIWICQCGAGFTEGSLNSNWPPHGKPWVHSPGGWSHRSGLPQ